MSNSPSSSKVVAILIAIALAVVALMGTEAWNRSHRNRAPAASPASVTPGSDAQTPGENPSPKPTPPPSDRSNGGLING